MDTVVTPLLTKRRRDGKENLSPLVAFKAKRQKHLVESPVRARPFLRRNVNSPASANVSYASSTSSLASPLVRKKPMSKPGKSFILPDVSYMSSADNGSVVSDDTTFATPKKILPLRRKRRDVMPVDVLYEDSVDESFTESFKAKKLLRRNNKMERTMDISYKSSTSEGNETTESWNILTPLSKKRPLRVSARNRSLHAISYITSPELSLESPLAEKSSPSDVIENSSITEHEHLESPRDISLSGSKGLANKSCTLSQETCSTESPENGLVKKPPLRVSPRNRSMQDISYVTSQELDLESPIRELPFAKKSAPAGEAFFDVTANSSTTEQLRHVASSRDISIRRSKRLADKSCTPTQEISSTESGQNSLMMFEKSVASLSLSIQGIQDPDDSLENPLHLLPLSEKLMSEQLTDKSFENSFQGLKRLDKTLTPSQDISLRKRPLSVAAQNRSMQDVSYLASQDPEDSLQDPRRQLPLAKKSNPFELSFHTPILTLEKIRDDSFHASGGNVLPRSTRSSAKSLTLSQVSQNSNLTLESSFQEPRPLKKSTANRTLKGISYIASPEGEESFRKSHRLMGKHGHQLEISFSGLSYQESLMDSNERSEVQASVNESEEESQVEVESEIEEESTEKAESEIEEASTEKDKSESEEEPEMPENIDSIRRSSRISSRILTPSQDSNLTPRSCLEKSMPFKISSVNEAMKETSYLSSQESLEQNRRLLGKQDRKLEVSFSGFSYQESLVDTTTRSEALISEKESESEEESKEAEDKLEEEPDSTRADEPESLFEDDDVQFRNASIEERLSIRMPAAEPAGPSTCDSPEYVHPLDHLPMSDSDRLALERVKIRIKAIIKEAKENVRNRFQLNSGYSPEPEPQPRKRSTNPVPRQKIMRPKLYKPAPWANKRLYDYLSKKLDPHYGLRRMLKAEEIVKTMYETVQAVEKNKTFQKKAVNQLKLELAQANIIETTDDFYRFIRSFMSRTCENRMIPSVQPFTNVIWPPKDDLKREWEKILD